MDDLAENQLPTFSLNWDVPGTTDGDIAAELAAIYYEEPQPWQHESLRVMLARGKDGRLYHPTLAMSIPRQNGKSWDVRARCFFGITVLGERIIYTCQNQDTADEMMEEFRKPFMDERNAELRAKSQLRFANGQGYVRYDDERIDPETGEVTEIHGYIFFTTRSNMKSRGKSFDVIIYDEAQELTRGQQKASRPTISAGARGDSQAIYIGTPEDENSHGDVFPSMRERVRNGTSDTAWAEWALECKVSDLAQAVQDRKTWWRTNPGWDYIIVHSAVEGEFSDMEPRDFAGDRLGWWMPRHVEDEERRTFIPRTMWEDTAIETLVGFPESKRALGLKFDHVSGSWALAGCVIAKDGTAGFELVAVGDGSSVGDIAEKIVAVKSRVSGVYIDGQRGQNLIESVPNPPKGYLNMAKTAEMANACGMLYDELDDGNAVHVSCRTQRTLDNAAETVGKRKIGTTGGWGFDGPGAAVMEACALALYAAHMVKRNPKRRQQLL